jgi:hypothetical protein
VCRLVLLVFMFGFSRFVNEALTGGAVQNPDYRNAVLRMRGLVRTIQTLTVLSMLFLAILTGFREAMGPMGFIFFPQTLRLCQLFGFVLALLLFRSPPRQNQIAPERSDAGAAAGTAKGLNSARSGAWSSQQQQQQTRLTAGGAGGGTVVGASNGNHGDAGGGGGGGNGTAEAAQLSPVGPAPRAAPQTAGSEVSLPHCGRVVKFGVNLRMPPWCLLRLPRVQAEAERLRQHEQLLLTTSADPMVRVLDVS